MISIAVADSQLAASIPEQRVWAQNYMQKYYSNYRDQLFYGNIHPAWFGYEIVDHRPFLEDCPHSRQWFDSRDLMIRHLALITLGPRHVSPLHRDRLLPDQDPWALNINIENGDKTWTEAYRVDHTQGKLVTNDRGDMLRFYQADNRYLISRWTLEIPRLFNTQIAHRVINDTDSVRTVLSFRFWQSPLLRLTNDEMKNDKLNIR